MSSARWAICGGRRGSSPSSSTYAIRDGIGYEIYGADLSRAGLRASSTVAAGRGLCLHKSTLYAACARALGIPSRLALVDVRNHVVSPRLRRFLGSDVVHFHCYAQVELDGRWVSATPVFSRALCRLYRMAPLEFGGVLQENDGSRMEVVRRHGTFDDLPYELVAGGLRAAHPNLFAAPSRVRGRLAGGGGGMKIKVCGVTERAEVELLGRCGVDGAGLWHWVTGGDAELSRSAFARRAADARACEVEPVLVTFAADPGSCARSLARARSSTCSCTPTSCRRSSPRCAGRACTSSRSCTCAAGAASRSG